MAAAQLEGQIETVTFNSEETGFTVARLKVAGRREPVTVVGQLMAPTPGEILHLKGEWIRHPTYGEQFKVEHFQSKVPATVSGIKKYLGSGLIKGIGPVMAKRIVDRFGAETLDVIGQSVHRLEEVEGIGPKRIDMIQAAWAEQQEIRRLMIFLQDNNVGPGHATRIFKRYGDRAVEVLQENPYRLAHDIRGIGFVTADRIAVRLGIPPDSVMRAEAGVMHTLMEMADQGHVYYPLDILTKKCVELLEVRVEVVEDALAGLSNESRIVVEDLEHEKKAVFLAGYHRAETMVAKFLSKLNQEKKRIREFDADKALAWVQSKLNIQLAQKQMEAVKRAAQDKVLIITGGPGTGKTTIIQAVLAIYHQLGAAIVLAAPTGRAAKRMAETTGFEAKTIHRLLDFNWQDGRFRKNEDQPLDADLVIVDEASMVDILLMHHLLKAIPDPATLIIVGDVDQLPSVGPGSVLGDLISSEQVPVVRLTEIFRQARESQIIVNAHRINQGVMPHLTPPAGRLEDFYFIERSDPEAAVQTIIELVSERIPQKFGLDPVNDVQILSPMHRGSAGAANLNEALQKALNPRTDGIQRGGIFFRPGDKVMQIRNNYDKEIFNGDIGRVSGYDPERRELLVDFEGQRTVYDFSDLDELVLAYAVSVHKSQGSEFPAVLLPLLTQHYVMLQRNLLYTAVTRGKGLVVIVGSKKALYQAVTNDRTSRRFTRLADRLRKELRKEGLLPL